MHGSLGSFTKLGLDPQEDHLKSGIRPPAPGWGEDPLTATLSVWRDGVCRTRERTCIAGDYPAYYSAVRDAICGLGPNPVTADEGIAVMGLLELGLQSARAGHVLSTSPSLPRPGSN